MVGITRPQALLLIVGLSIAGSILYASFGVVAAIPASTAIIIGVLIIEGSRAR
ncbi:hypothetical protein ACEN9H_08440 [Massilia cellulosiltytica]|uniref:hypothetical protein n=1 Tax=Massilia cellulosiltytica TaxID=2683234 RepID=UPI0039B5ECE2